MIKDLTNGVLEIAKERNRQISKEGYTLDHDKHHSIDEFIKAAAAYLICNENSKDIDYEYEAKTIWRPWIINHISQKI